MQTILDKTAPGKARATVYDYGHATDLGRYSVRKVRFQQGKRERMIQSTVYYHQRPAAEDHAVAFMAKWGGAE